MKHFRALNFQNTRRDNNHEHKENNKNDCYFIFKLNRYREGRGKEFLICLKSSSPLQLIKHFKKAG